MRRVLIVLVGVLAFAALSSQAEAGRRHGHGNHHGHRSHHGHGHHGHSYGGHSYHAGPYVSFALGPALWWAPSWRRSQPYPYYHETTVIGEPRPVYVERPPSTPPVEGWWYYCESAGAYYPEVAGCSEPWLKVPPRPE